MHLSIIKDSKKTFVSTQIQLNTLGFSILQIQKHVCIIIHFSFYTARFKFRYLNFQIINSI